MPGLSVEFCLAPSLLPTEAAPRRLASKVLRGLSLIVWRSMFLEVLDLRVLDWARPLWLSKDVWSKARFMSAGTGTGESILSFSRSTLE